MIFCVQCLASFVFWKAGLSGKAAFYLTYLCPVFRAGDFTISCCMGCLYHSRKQESGLPGGAFSLLELAAVLLAGGCLFIAAKQVGVLARWPSGTMCCSLPLRCCWSGCLPW